MFVVRRVCKCGVKVMSVEQEQSFTLRDPLVYTAY